MTAETGTVDSVRFARRSARGLILGLSAPRVAAVGAAAAVAVLALFALGVTGLAATGVFWAPVGASAFVRIGGRTAVEWAPTFVNFRARKAAGQTEFRVRPGRPRPAGTLALPGDAAALRLHVDSESGAAMIHDPHRQTLTVSTVVTHPAFALLDDGDRAGRVGRWGRALAGLASTGANLTAQVLEATVPDPAAGQREWWQTHGAHHGRWADTEYETLLDQVALDASTHRTTVALTLDMKGAARTIRAAGRGIAAAASVLRADMANFTVALHQAGLRPGSWLGEADLAAVIRHAFDPATLLDPADPGANLAHAGPVAISEEWDRLRHDTGWSQVLWISEWPRIAVAADFLHPLIFAPGVRRALSLYARPVPTDAALRDIRREKTDAVADSTQKARVGQLADLSDAQEYDDLLSRERSIIAGHTDVEFTGLVTVTAPDPERLDAAAAAIVRAAAQACCEIRPVYGAQMQAFVAADLPLGRSPLP